MVHFLELLFFLLVIKAVLRCLYFWQLKEYRWDRFKAFLQTKQIRQYFLPTRSFLRPRFTFKVILLFSLSFYLSFQILRFINHQLLAVLLAYFSIPFFTALAVTLFIPFTNLTYQLIISLARFKLSLRSRPLIVIGITGSFGKTATKEILSHLLKAKHSLCSTSGTQNTPIGVALTVLKKLQPSHQIFVVEMGAYRLGEISQICRLVKPQIGILTGINQQHLGLFGSQANIIQAKYELIKSLPQDGLAVFNGDNSHTLKLAQNTRQPQVLIYHSPKKPFKTNLLGSHQQLNIQAAVLVAQHLHIPLSTIKKRLLSLPVFKTAWQSLKGINQSKIINDSYNSNPDGFLSAINYLKTLPASSKILVTPAMIELGSQAKSVHQTIARQAVKVFDKIYLTKPDFVDVFQSTAQTNKSSQTKVIFQPNYRQLTKTLKPQLKPKSALLLEGRLPAKFIRSLCLSQF